MSVSLYIILNEAYAIYNLIFLIFALMVAIPAVVSAVFLFYDIMQAIGFFDEDSFRRFLHAIIYSTNMKGSK